MLLVLEDDDCIHVYPSLEAASAAIEALDANQTIRAAFDETAVPYRIQWLRPNKIGQMLGVLRSCVNGSYCLVPAGPPGCEALGALISGRQVVPVEAATAIDRLRASL